MNNLKNIKATCAILDRSTDKVISERLIGYYDDADIASYEAHLQRKDNECVCIYGAPISEPEELSALEMAEKEYDWNEITGR